MKEEAAALASQARVRKVMMRKKRKMTSKETLWRPHQPKERKLLQKSLLGNPSAWPRRKMKKGEMKRKKKSLWKKHLKDQRRKHPNGHS